jgi:hypothetical protein
MDHPSTGAAVVLIMAAYVDAKRAGPCAVMDD